MKSSKLVILSLLFVLVISTFSISYAAYTSPYSEPSYLVKYGMSRNWS